MNADLLEIKNLLIARKAITPIIATILLLMMTIAAAGFVFTFVIGLQNMTQSATYEQTRVYTVQQSAKVKVDYVFNSSNLIAVAVKNIGSYTYTTSDMSNFRVLINGIPKTIPSANWGTSLAPGSTVEVNTSEAWGTVGRTLILRVIPPFGDEGSYTCTTKVDYC